MQGFSLLPRADALYPVRPSRLKAAWYNLAHTGPLPVFPALQPDLLSSTTPLQQGSRRPVWLLTSRDGRPSFCCGGRGDKHIRPIQQAVASRPPTASRRVCESKLPQLITRSATSRRTGPSQSGGRAHLSSLDPHRAQDLTAGARSAAARLGCARPRLEPPSRFLAAEAPARRCRCAATGWSPSANHGARSRGSDAGQRVRRVRNWARRSG